VLASRGCAQYYQGMTTVGPLENVPTFPIEGLSSRKTAADPSILNKVETPGPSPDDRNRLGAIFLAVVAFGCPPVALVIMVCGLLAGNGWRFLLTTIARLWNGTPNRELEEMNHFNDIIKIIKSGDRVDGKSPNKQLIKYQQRYDAKHLIKLSGEFLMGTRDAWNEMSISVLLRDVLGATTRSGNEEETAVILREILSKLPPTLFFTVPKNDVLIAFLNQEQIDNIFPNNKIDGGKFVQCLKNWLQDLTTNELTALKPFIEKLKKSPNQWDWAQGFLLELNKRKNHEIINDTPKQNINVPLASKPPTTMPALSNAPKDVKCQISKPETKEELLVILKECNNDGNSLIKALSGKNFFPNLINCITDSNRDEIYQLLSPINKTGNSGFLVDVLVNSKEVCISRMGEVQHLIEYIFNNDQSKIANFLKECAPKGILLFSPKSKNDFVGQITATACKSFFTDKACVVEFFKQFVVEYNTQSKSINSGSNFASLISKIKTFGTIDKTNIIMAISGSAKFVKLDPHFKDNKCEDCVVNFIELLSN
jgi:hypothetical protein